MKSTTLTFLKIFLVVQGIFIGGILTLPEVLASNSPPGETITLKINGWTCASCEKDVHTALMGVSGVQSAEVSYPRGGAIVVVEPGKVNAEQLVQAIRGASNIFDTYKATIVPNGSLSTGKDGSSVLGSFWSSLFK